MKATLHEWVAVHRPVDSDGKEIKDQLKIIQEGKIFVTDTQKALLAIARLLPSEFDASKDDIEIILRPF